MAKQKTSDIRTRKAESIVPRSWIVSAVLSAAFIGASLALSAWVNPKLGRVMHWDWVAGGAPLLFVLLTLAFRRRWV
jgi:hypothetical protein